MVNMLIACCVLCLPYFTVFLQPQIYLDASLQQTEINCRRTVEESHCPNTESVDDLADEDGCIQGRKTKKDNSKQIWNVHLNRRTGVSNSYVLLRIPDCRAIGMRYLLLKSN